MAAFVDCTGRRFGRLVAIAVASKASRKTGNTRWLCHCDCGNETVVAISNLRGGHTLSCGCYMLQRARESARTHGGKGTALYGVWCTMRARCNNPNNNNYRHYGARGIDVCSDWSDFARFQLWASSNGYRRGLSIDRIDANKGYSPENCRWTDAKAQARNRPNHNIMFEYRGVTACLAEHVERSGLKYATVNRRIRVLGWTAKAALETPARQSGRWPVECCS